jgi:hypothetical protein
LEVARTKGVHLPEGKQEMIDGTVERFHRIIYEAVSGLLVGVEDAAREVRADDGWRLDRIDGAAGAVPAGQ